LSLLRKGEARSTIRLEWEAISFDVLFLLPQANGVGSPPVAVERTGTGAALDAQARPSGQACEEALRDLRQHEGRCASHAFRRHRNARALAMSSTPHRGTSPVRETIGVATTVLTPPASDSHFASSLLPGSSTEAAVVSGKTPDPIGGTLAQHRQFVTC